jgi:hypothetical protein
MKGSITNNRFRHHSPSHLVFSLTISLFRYVPPSRGPSDGHDSYWQGTNPFRLGNVANVSRNWPHPLEFLRGRELQTCADERWVLWSRVGHDGLYVSLVLS